ncbi:hypothetical protein [Halopelagius longus]|uniref:Small CPxCG-related zinc finger protein n=1 Tax=Halopelagius longus TaxID=1236180 RepID=A0A1H1ERY1_9EURY|nr:hypothetical protein [Halopelagius longus]SDQ91507.1 hypothetical protein SAMN05216278_3037 [Halopelagius longus]
MDLLMCRSCGEFTEAVEEDRRLVPTKDGCPHCGEVEFKNTGTGNTVQLGE